jgi:hypothetical protein
MQLSHSLYAVTGKKREKKKAAKTKRQAKKTTTTGDIRKDANNQLKKKSGSKGNLAYWCTQKGNTTAGEKKKCNPVGVESYLVLESVVSFFLYFLLLTLRL